MAAEEILVTLQPHFLALQGMTKLIETARLVRQRLNPGLRVTGLVFCMYDGRATLSSEVIADVEGFFSRAATGENPLLREARVLRTRVRRNIKLAELRRSNGQASRLSAERTSASSRTRW